MFMRAFIGPINATFSMLFSWNFRLAANSAVKHNTGNHAEKTPALTSSQSRGRAAAGRKIEKEGVRKE